MLPDWPPIANDAVSEGSGSQIVEKDASFVPQFDVMRSKAAYMSFSCAMLWPKPAPITRPLTMNSMAPRKFHP
jgi:hypothetical protein